MSLARGGKVAARGQQVRWTGQTMVNCGSAGPVVGRAPNRTLFRLHLSGGLLLVGPGRAHQRWAPPGSVSNPQPTTYLATAVTPGSGEWSKGVACCAWRVRSAAGQPRLDRATGWSAKAQWRRAAVADGAAGAGMLVCLVAIEARAGGSVEREGGGARSRLACWPAGGGSWRRARVALHVLERAVATPLI